MSNVLGKFKEWHKKMLFMPNSEIIVCFCHQPPYAPKESIYDVNHNVFRLTAYNQIIWQVQRDDSNHPPGWWDTLNHHARQDGLDGARCPFTDIALKYPSGEKPINTKPANLIDEHEEESDDENELFWTPGCYIWLEGSAHQQYILDPNTGIAKNVTPAAAAVRSSQQPGYNPSTRGKPLF